jgi:hypothetical protein
MFSPILQVKQYLTRLVRANGDAFDVFATGDPKWILLRPVIGHTNGQGGYHGGIDLPVKRMDLKPEIRRMIPRP